MRIPDWARTDVEQFMQHRHLPGAGVSHLDLPEADRDQVDADLSGTLDTFRRLDESERDLAPGQPGVLVLKQPGLKVTTEFEGDGRQGSARQYIDLPDPTWFTMILTPDGVDGVWVTRTAAGTTAQGLHLDRREPGKSWSELRPAPEA